MRNIGLHQEGRYFYRRIIFLVFLSAIFADSAFGQNLYQTVKGKVLDKTLQTTLPGANIVILKTNPPIGAMTDNDGTYKIEKVPIGRYDVQASYIGYEPMVIKEVVIGSGKEVVLNFELKESIIDLDAVEVKAVSSKEQPLNYMAIVSARQLNMEEASRYAGGFDDPSRLAASFAGVAGNLSGNGIAIRGNSPKGLLWKMEGIEISNPSHFANVTTFGAGGITALSSQMLANSDFYTGAFPAEYGNALSGVFDIQLRTGNNETREHTFKVGIIGTDISSEGPFVKGSPSSYLFNYRFSTFSIIAPLLPENAGAINYHDLCFKLNFPTEKYGTIALWGIAAYDVSGGKSEKDSLKWEYDQDRQEDENENGMGALGLNHKIILGRNAYLSSSLSASGNSLRWDVDRLDENLNFFAKERISNITWKASFSSFINVKFSPRHSNKTGFTASRLFYDVDIKHYVKEVGGLLQTVNEDGHADLLQAYTQSNVEIFDDVTFNPGLSFQYFTLNKNFSVEPRAALKWAFAKDQSVSIGYGLHSQLEMVGIYLAQRHTSNGIEQPNRELDFAKAHHFALAYEIRLNENLRFKIEPYYQYLFDVPVIADSSFSMLNLEKDWFFNDPLVNKGTGKNIGVDITLERFLSGGYYYMITGSVFD
ncbi:MAG TPA: carboxypeptidase-like regulatory domain-containing protein, partial [Ignavibacteriales bacterium]|nr:carboxypeptidase-like regulatory domain-containing protein [Ignavibacteriales bacterium]